MHFHRIKIIIAIIIAAMAGWFSPLPSRVVPTPAMAADTQAMNAAAATPDTPAAGVAAGSGARVSTSSFDQRHIVYASNGFSLSNSNKGGNS